MARLTRRKLAWAAAVLALLLIGGALAPLIVRSYWSSRSTNPVRRGVQRAAELGCFSCHGTLGREGIPDPAAKQGVPAWSGGVWMMYVENDSEIRRFILDGSATHDERDAAHEHETAAIAMPAYRDALGGSDLADLVAAFKVLAGMSVPEQGSPARHGYDLARRWHCFNCHGPAGSGGLANPGSFTGFVPGWYGADFDDLVRDRGEFDEWTRSGTLSRLENHPIAPFFMRRQRISMPAYARLTPADLDDLWAYVLWLDRTDGGHEGADAPWGGP